MAGFHPGFAGGGSARGWRILSSCGETAQGWLDGLKNSVSSDGENVTIIDDIKARISIEDLVQETPTVKLKKSGKNWTGYCPFHANKHTPALVVFPDTGTWKCFGSCNEGGDIFDWVQKQNAGWDLKEAIKHLAGKANLPMPSSDDRDLKERISARMQADTLKLAMDVFKKWLWEDADALAYARDRGWTDEEIKASGIGFSGRTTAAQAKEMRGVFDLHGIDPHSPQAVMILGFSGDVAKWAEAHDIDPKALPDGYIHGMMGKPGLIYAHKIDGKISYLSRRNLPGFDDVKSFNPYAALAGERTPYMNRLYRSRYEGAEKGKLLLLFEGQGCAVTAAQFGYPAMALCGSSWRFLIESGIIEQLKNDYETITYIKDLDKSGETVVTGNKNDFPLSTAFGPMLWIGTPEARTWTRPDGGEKSIKDLNDAAQWARDEKIEKVEVSAYIKKMIELAQPIVLLAAQYAGSQKGQFFSEIVKKVALPLILAMPKDAQNHYAVDLATALYPDKTKSEAKAAFTKLVGEEIKAKAKSGEEDRVEIVPTFGEWIPSAEDPQVGWLIEMIYDPETGKGALAYRNPQGEIGVSKELEINRKRYVPNLDEFVRKGVVVFPSALGPLKSTSELLFTHELFLRRSFLLDKPSDYKMASYYSVFTWVYDCFGELPFLRARGGKDTGKSAFMLRLGYFCYRLCKSTGIGSTASLKHAQEKYKGTIFFDEMDIADKFDERIVMLNVRAMKDQAYVWSMKPVTVDGQTVYEPQAHNVYGPALITMYGSFTDEATDSRCITFDLFGKDLSELKKAGIPRRLNQEWHRDAAEIRNMSLHWRLKWWKPSMEIPEELEDEMVSTRANQVTTPIKYIVKDDPKALEDVTNAVREMYESEILERAQSFPARFLEAIISLMELPKYQFLGFVKEGDLKEFGHAKYIRYPDLAKTVNYIIDEMNTGVAKDVNTLLKVEEADKETEEKGKKGKKGKKKGDEEGVSSKTVGNVVRKDLRLPVERLGAGYVVIVWSQKHPAEVQERIARLRSKFGLDFIKAEAADEPVNVPVEEAG